jgi:CBS domain-containing protein
MRKNIGTLDAVDTIAEAAIRMKDEDVSASFVKFDDRILGFVPRKDLVRNTLSVGLNPMSTMVLRMAYLGYNSCRCTDDADEVLNDMKDRNLKFIIVKDHDNKPVGILSYDELRKRLLKWKGIYRNNEMNVYDREIHYLVR